MSELLFSTSIIKRSFEVCVGYDLKSFKVTGHSKLNSFVGFPSSVLFQDFFLCNL